MQIELKRIQSQVGITFIYVTHDEEEALSTSDRVAVMSNGVIAESDSCALHTHGQSSTAYRSIRVSMFLRLPACHGLACRKGG